MVRYAVVVLVLLAAADARARDQPCAGGSDPLPIGAAIAPPSRPAPASRPRSSRRSGLPAAAIPASPAIVDVWLATLAPGEAIASETRAFPPSIVADVVLGGELIVRSAGRVLVQRAAGLEEVAPNTVVTIHPDEAIIYVDNQAAQSFRNPGRGTLTALSVGVNLRRPALDVHGGGGGPGGLGALRPRRARPDRRGGTAHGTAGGASPGVWSGRACPACFRGGGGRGPGGGHDAHRRGPPPAARFGPGQVVGFRTLDASERLQVRNAGVRSLVLLQVTLGAERTATPMAGPPRPRKWPVMAPGTVPGLAAADTSRGGNTRGVSAVNVNCEQRIVLRRSSLARSGDGSSIPRATDYLRRGCFEKRRLPRDSRRTLPPAL